MLTAERLRQLLHYDPLTGVFTRRVSVQGYDAGTVAGGLTCKGRYINVGVDRKRYYAHRLAWLYMTGDWPTFFVDHEDTNGLNNRWKNLRDRTQAINTQNTRRARSTNLLGILGVSKTRRGTFTSRIVLDGNDRHLGTFASAQAASDAYIAAKRQLHEGCTI